METDRQRGILGNYGTQELDDEGEARRSSTAGAWGLRFTRTTSLMSLPGAAGVTNQPANEIRGGCRTVDTGEGGYFIPHH